MEEIIDNALRPHPAGEVLSEGFRLQITRNDMETLSGLNWLNDEVSINYRGVNPGSNFRLHIISVMY